MEFLEVLLGALAFPTEVWIAIVTGVFGLAGAWLKLRKSTPEAPEAIPDISSVKSFSGFLTHWNEIERQIHGLFRDTKADRFLILQARNGKDKPTKTTAIYQTRDGGQRDFDYIDFPLDDDYRQRLELTEYSGPHVIDVAGIPDSFIKAVYQNEEVHHSVWWPIAREDYKRYSIIVYASIATHSEEPFDQNELVRQRMLMGQVQEMSQHLLGER